MVEALFKEEFDQGVDGAPGAEEPEESVPRRRRVRGELGQDVDEDSSGEEFEHSLLDKKAGFKVEFGQGIDEAPSSGRSRRAS